jgi:voltage-gated potassium channel
MKRMNQERWRQLTDWPLTAAAVIFLVAYAWQVLADLQPGKDGVTDAIMWAVWVLFAVDFVANLILAERKVRWFFTHFYEFLVVALPALRPLRLLRLISLLSILQRAAGRALRGRVLVYAIGASVILVITASLAMLDVERHAPGSNITNIGDSLWWAVVTITTVGYGDVAPVTAEGRLIAVAVMIAGIALLGTVTATLASFFIDRVAETATAESDETQSEIQALTREIQALRAEVAGFAATTAPAAGSARSDPPLG